MSPPAAIADLVSNLQVSDTAFDEQVAATREALKTFSVVTAINTSGPARIALEELVNATVCSTIFLNLSVPHHLKHLDSVRQLHSFP
jgi:hypothetical protein